MRKPSNNTNSISSDIRENLSLLGLREHAQKVILFLLSNKPCSASEIAKSIHIPRSTTYDALEELLGLGLVAEYQNKKREFGITSIQQFSKLYTKKVEEIKKSQIALENLLPLVSQSASDERPKVKFYSGTNCIEHALNDISWSSDIPVAYLMWPTKNMLESVSEDFLKSHSEKRFKHKVFIKSIRKDSDRVIKKGGHQWLDDNNKNNLREIRHAPKDIDWEMAYWIYGNQCLFNPTNQDKFAFIVTSKEFADLMRTLWEQVWNISKK